MKEIPFNTYKEMLLHLDDLRTLSEFREQVLYLFEKHFGLEHSIFWLCRDKGEIYSPVTRNTPEKSLHQYIHHYHDEDFLLPIRVSSLLSNTRVLRIEDIVSKQEYEDSLFYNGFMKPHHHYHEMGVYLISQNKLIGGISFIGEQGNAGFNDKAANSIDLLSHFISLKLQYILKHSPNNSPIEDVKLTPSEEKICDLLQLGLTNQEMADHLFVSLHTIKKHLQNIYKKLGVTNRTSLLSRMIQKNG
ncbi:hypothetical protein AC623_04425 [Bacillus sp. FJAT-27231]|uniref:helix-turn-helix transcriptional regulator n=1 Tax=Bacillus sp. FJAT-27231 TaxID=1679168 RepID=UPI0006709173|nr:helix-turn-helix transcriptional regulator [Bacillus sp. FJAT-27231]KMY53330.1 hypothetical protein AC623_04425 [Bacillus sp. FJAT-27231]